MTDFKFPDNFRDWSRRTAIVTDEDGQGLHLDLPHPELHRQEPLPPTPEETPRFSLRWGRGPK